MWRLTPSQPQSTQSPCLIPYHLHHAYVPHNLIQLYILCPFVFKSHYWNLFLATQLMLRYFNYLYTQCTDLFIFIIILGPLTDTYYSPIPWASSAPPNVYKYRLCFRPSCRHFTSLYIIWELERHLPCLLCCISLSVHWGTPGRALLQVCAGILSAAESLLILEPPVYSPKSAVFFICLNPIVNIHYFSTLSKFSYRNAVEIIYLS